MTWLNDPELYIGYSSKGRMQVYRIRKKFGTPLVPTDLNYNEAQHVTDHLALVGHSFPWKKSDYDALDDFIYKNGLYVNCQGLVCPITIPHLKPDMKPGRRIVYFWSLEVLDLRRFGLPAATVPFREVHYIENGGLAAVESSPKEKELTAELTAAVSDRDNERRINSILQEKLNAEIDKEREERRILEDIISGLKDDLHKSRNPKELTAETDKERAERRILEGLLEKANTEIDKEREERRDLEKQNSSLQKEFINEINKEREERRILEDTNSKLIEEMKTEMGKESEERKALERLLEKANTEIDELKKKNKKLRQIIDAEG